MQRLRTSSRVGLMILVTVHMVTWYALGMHFVGSIAIEALFSGLARGVLNAGFVFWLSVFVSAVLLGRAFCGWFCWFGGYLELSEWSIGRLNIRVPRPMLMYLGVLPFVSLAMKMYTALLQQWLREFPAAFTLNLADTEPLAGQGATPEGIVLTLIVFGPVLLLVFGRRAWCRHLCPVGALLKVFSIASPGKIRLVNDECLGCASCNRACDMQIDVLGELRAHGEVRSLDCIRCFKCVDECPQGALALTMRRQEAALSPAAAKKAERISLRRRKLSALDVIVAVLWSTITLTLALSGGAKGGATVLKTISSAGLLVVLYGMALGVQYAYGKIRK